MQTTSYLLTWITFVPLMGAAAIMLLLGLKGLFKLNKGLVDNASRVVALAAGIVPLVLACFLWKAFDGGASAPQFQFVHHFVWVKSFNIEYFLGVDGLSVSMVILSALVSFVALVASMPWWGETDEHHFSRNKVPGYLIMFLLLETGMTGVFASLDFFLFYVFWEVMLLPMYFLIGIWGGPRKEYAAIKFFLYTLAGSVLMLLAIIGLYYQSNPNPAATPFALVDGTQVAHTFNMIYLTQLGQAGQWSRVAAVWPGAFGGFATLVWIAFFIGFAIKVPMVPFHTWLPDAHVEAPTPISVILAGVLLKMGIYGMLRVNWAILPQTTKEMAYAVGVFGAVNIVYAAMVCLAQKDLKRLIAYSSVSHMGFCLLGMAAMTPQGMSGAVFNMWTHGIVSAMLFLIVGVIYDRAHHRQIEGFGGLAQQVPEYTAIMGLAFFASLGLPGLCGFISEFLVFAGAFGSPISGFTLLTAVSATSVIITAAYYLWTIQRMFLGKLNEKYASMPDLNWRERFALYPLGVMAIVFGFYPNLMLDLMNGTLATLVKNVLNARS